MRGRRGSLGSDMRKTEIGDGAPVLSMGSRRRTSGSGGCGGGGVPGRLRSGGGRSAGGQRPFAQRNTILEAELALRILQGGRGER